MLPCVIDGTTGVSGTGLHPLQFDAVADVSFGTDKVIFVSDGDGGVNNRVLKLDSSLSLLYVFTARFAPLRPVRLRCMMPVLQFNGVLDAVESQSIAAFSLMK